MSARCWCGRLVLPTSLDGINCARHDDELPRPRGPWFYGLEYDGPRCGCGTPVDNDGDLCPECEGFCPQCHREVTRPGLCFDCDVEADHVGGFAPGRRFRA